MRRGAPVARATAAVLGACLCAERVAGQLGSCAAIPPCSTEPEGLVRAWVPKRGRVQRSCDAGGGASWATGCVSDCVGAGGGAAYTAVHFADVNTGWLASDGGKLMKTTDGGATWKEQGVDIATPLWGVHFPTPWHGFLIGAGSAIGRSIDGGATWAWRADLREPGQNSLFGVYFYSAAVGWIVGSAGRTYRTMDGGLSWELKTYQIGLTNYAVHFADGQSGLVVGSRGHILWSPDGGDTWTEVPSGSGADLLAAHCSNSTVAYAAGLAGTLLRTMDGGLSWHGPSDGSVSAGMSFAGIRFGSNGSSSLGWAVGQNGLAGLLLSTADGGDTWQADRQTSLLNQRLYGVAVVSVEVPLCATTTTTPPPPGATTRTKTTTTPNVEANELEEATLELLTQVSSDPNITTQSVNISFAAVTAYRLSLASVGKDGYAIARAANSTATVWLPASLLEQIGNNSVVLIKTWGLGRRPSWDPDPAAQLAMEGPSGAAALAAPPVGVDLTTDGAAIQVSNLSDPILISIPGGDQAGYTCAFWNETSKAWSDEGISPHSRSGDGVLVCATTHLSVFGVVAIDVLRGIQSVLVCTQVQVLTPEGMRGLGSGLACSPSSCLWKSPAFYLFWAVMFFQCGVIMWARRRDAAWRHAGLWCNKCFLTENAYFERLNVTPIQKVCGFCNGVVRDPLSNLSLYTFEFCVRHTVAAKLCIAPRDLQVVMDWAQKTTESPKPKRKRKGKKAEVQVAPEDSPGATEDLGTRRKEAIRLLAYVPTIHECMDTESKELKENIRHRRHIWELGKSIFLTRNAWTQLGHFSISHPGSEKSMFLTMRICTAWFVTALWYQKGDSTSSTDDERCAEVTTAGSIIGRSILVSFLSLILGTLPQLLMAYVMRREFMYREEWTKPEARKQLRRWRLRQRLFWCIGVLWMLFTMFFVTSFLANVKPQDNTKFIITALIALAKLSVFVPLLVGLGLVLLASLTMPRLPESLIRRARQELRLEVATQSLRALTGLQHHDHPQPALHSDGAEDPDAALEGRLEAGDAYAAAAFPDDASPVVGTRLAPSSLPPDAWEQPAPPFLAQAGQGRGHPRLAGAGGGGGSPGGIPPLRGGPPPPPLRR